MKKRLLKTTLLILSVNMCIAQFTVNKIDGTPYTNGEVIEFTTHSSSASELKFVVYNNSAENLDFKIRCMDLINTTGDNFQLCWSFECIPGVSLNSIYPDYPNIINAGANTSGLGDNFKNFSPGDGANYPMDFSFRFFTRNIEGANVGSAFNLTYRYQGPLSIDQKNKLDLMGIKVLNTIVDNFVGLEINKTVSFSLLNLQGQTINSGKLDSNTNLDLSHLQSGIYLLNFSSSEGLSDTLKIYKK